jgi:hypothetical protein
MINNLIEFLDYGIFAEVALLIFASVFVLIVTRTLLIRREISQRHASIVLDDNPPTSNAHKIKEG